MSVFDKIKIGPNHVVEYEVDGVMYPIRHGTRSERNKIEKSLNDQATPFDSVMLFMFLRAADENGDRYFQGQNLRDVADAGFDLDVCKALFVQANTPPSEDADDDGGLSDNMSFDEKTELLVKNSAPQRGVTSTS